MHLLVGSSKPCCGNYSILEFRTQVKRFRNCSYSSSHLVFLSSRSAPLHRKAGRATGCSVAWRHKEQLHTVLAYINSAYSYFEKGCRKNVHATIPKGNMGCDNTLFKMWRMGNLWLCYCYKVTFFAHPNSCQQEERPPLGLQPQSIVLKSSLELNRKLAG